MKLSIYQFFQHLSGKLMEGEKVKHMVWGFWTTLAALMLWAAPLTFVTVYALVLPNEYRDSLYGNGFFLSVLFL